MVLRAAAWMVGEAGACVPSEVSGVIRIIESYILLKRVLKGSINPTCSTCVVHVVDAHPKHLLSVADLSEVRGWAQSPPRSDPFANCLMRGTG